MVRRLNNGTGRVRGPGTPNPVPGVPMPENIPTPLPTHGPHMGTNAQGYDPIRYGANNDKWGYAKVGQARNQPGFVPKPPYHWGLWNNLPPATIGDPLHPAGSPAGSATPAGGAGGGGNGAAPGAPLPTLTDHQRKILDSLYGGNNGSNYGIKAAPGTEASYRRFLRQGLAAGLSNKDINNFLRPGFYRSVSDPYGRSGLLKGLDSGAYKSLLDFAKGGQGGLGPEGQAAFFAANPALHEKYMQMANVYGHAPDVTNALSTTPPHAVLGSDGKYHDPQLPLPAGVTLDSSYTAQPTDWGQSGARFQAGQTQYNQMDPQVAALANIDPNSAGSGTGGGATNMSTPDGAFPTGGASYGGYTSTQNSAATPNSPGAQNGGSAGNAPTYGGGASAEMPMTAQFEATNRGIQDQLSAALAQAGVANEQIPAQVQAIMARITTDQTYGLQGLFSDLGDRGLTLPGAGAYMLQRDVALPAGRAAQDAATQAAQAYASNATAQGDAYLQASQGTVEALLQRAQDLINSMPLGLSTSTGNLKTKRRNNRRKTKNKGKGGGK